MIKYIGVIVTIIIFLVGSFVTYGKLQAQSQTNEKRTDVLDIEVKKVTADVVELKTEQRYIKEKVDDIKAQSTKIEGKLDNIAGLLLKQANERRDNQ